MNPENFAKALLEHDFGFSVQKLPESDVKTPDFLVEHAGERFVIELKTRADSLAYTTERAKTLADGGIHEHTADIIRTNPIAKRIKEASRQLNSSYSKYFSIVWLMAIDQHQEQKFKQFESNLFGLVKIFDLEAMKTIPCYYFGLSDFYARRGSIDGAIISTDTHGVLCFNTHSKNYPAITDSVMARKFGGACRDPLRLESEGKAFVVDTEIDRNDHRALIKYLNEKYGRRKLSIMHRQYYESTFSVNSDMSEA